MMLAGGKVYLFSRKKCRAFRNDKHNWRKKNDNKTIKETHEKLKVKDKETLNCYYAHAENTDGLQRRCYWILDKQFDDVVLVHYLYSNTSRVVSKSSASQARSNAQSNASAKDRPRRAASMRNKFTSGLYTESSDEFIDRMMGTRRAETQELGTTSTDDHDDLGDPLDSFIAKLPADFGVTERDLSMMDQLPGDLSISALQLAKMIESSPNKKDLEGFLSIGNSSMGRADLQALIDGNHSPKKLGMTISDADSLLRGFSRLESLEFLKMVSPDINTSNNEGFDGHFGTSGIAFMPKTSSTDMDNNKMSQSTSGNQNQSSGSQGSQKVSTIRRVVAPGSSSGMSSFLTHPQDAGVGAERRRPNPISISAPKTGDARIREAVMAAKDHNEQMREDLLSKAREARDPATTGGQEAKANNNSNNKDGDLISPPTIFRMNSHVINMAPSPSRGTSLANCLSDPKSPEKAATLFKQMSIDDMTLKPSDSLLQSGLSLDLATVEEDPPSNEQARDSLGGFGSIEQAGTSHDDQGEPASRAPSFTSLRKDVCD
jgi:hypothetical protein